MGTKWTAERRAKYKATVSGKKEKVSFKKKIAALKPSILDILTYVRRAEACLDRRDYEGVDIYLKLARREAQGKE